NSPRSRLSTWAFRLRVRSSLSFIGIDVSVARLVRVVARMRTALPWGAPFFFFVECLGARLYRGWLNALPLYCGLRPSSRPSRTSGFMCQPEACFARRGEGGGLSDGSGRL